MPSTNNQSIWLRSELFLRRGCHCHRQPLEFHWSRVTRHARPTHRLSTSEPPDLGSFVCRIPPWFVVNLDLIMINVRAIWVRSALFYHRCLPSTIPLATGHCFPVTRNSNRPPPDQRVRDLGISSPAGYYLPPTTKLARTQRGPNSTNRPSILSMPPNQAILSEKAIHFLPARNCPTVDHFVLLEDRTDNQVFFDTQAFRFHLAGNTLEKVNHEKNTE